MNLYELVTFLPNIKLCFLERSGCKHHETLLNAALDVTRCDLISLVVTSFYSANPTKKIAREKLVFEELGIDWLVPMTEFL